MLKGLSTSVVLFRVRFRCAAGLVCVLFLFAAALPGFGTGVEPRTAEAIPDSLNTCEPYCSIEIPERLGHRRFVDVDGGAGGAFVPWSLA